ncbi:MAG: adenosylmethionine--8-amino-7-oxononanoate transaminase [Betaproteobacteria bacterium]|nr:adenosylmethionine--8-amino-7-oxononanoate transaminase [Betaproteobacteria bacterium]
MAIPVPEPHAVTRNADLVARSLAAVWHPCTQMKVHERLPLVPIARASGAWLEDFEGHRFVDGVSSWWVNLFGHGHPRIAAAIAEQAAALEHAMLAGFTHEPVVALSERLSAIAPGNLGHAFYASDGASATEIALKMAFHHGANRGKAGKDRFVALEGGYHGETVGALSVTDVAIFRDAYAPLLRRNFRVPFPSSHAASRATGGAECAREAAGMLARLFESEGESIAALIVEPLVQGAGGMRMYDPEYLRLARALCDRHEILLIADEIMTGFGRTGTMFACEQAGIAPDLLCLSKGITGGFLPLSCVLSTDEVYASFWDDDTARGFLHSHSYTGNPIACRAALAVLDLFEEGDVIRANRGKAARFDLIAAPLADQPGVRNLRRLGMIWAFEVETDEPRFARLAFESALADGALLRPIGNTVYFMPPYVIDDEDFATLVKAGIGIAQRWGRR